MSAETTVKVSVYAKKLRAQVVKLKTERVKALAKFDVEFIAWKKALSMWFDANSDMRVAQIAKKEAMEHRYYDRPTFDTQKFFRGAPEAPKFPDDKQLRAVQSRLRHITMTGQTTVRVTEDDTRTLFGEEE